MPLTLEQSGLEVLDLRQDEEFAARPLRARDRSGEIAGMQRIAHAFVETPETILNELVQVAVSLCGADSAGISIEREDRTEEDFYHWVATAGDYSAFLGARLPQFPSACGVTLERAHPQHFRVRKEFFDIMGIEAPLVTDGLLLPWRADRVRGTIFVMAHGRTDAFDPEDARMMEALANFAATGYRQIQQRAALIEQERASAAAAMANMLAHRINNPLQSLTNILYLNAQHYDGSDMPELRHEALADVVELSTLVRELLALPKGYGQGLALRWDLRHALRYI